MSAYTPGPWEVDPSYHWYERSVRPGKYHAQVRAMNGEAWTPIARCQSNAQSVDNEANARLIAAAPALLEACQTFVEWLRREKEGLPAGIERDTPEGERQWCTWWEEYLRIYDLAQQQAIAAIEKATGEQP
jgi:hypothetical protein